ncbi:YihY/virulence factor BrkB family protein [Stappia sp.]|uniref:YihY/virulence factor BrkB family protein n=1 Tax=Stappia sp. TaxID=1870903 RepID=UPI0032D99D01
MASADNAAVPMALTPAAWVSACRATARAAFDMETSLRCAGVAFFGFLSVFPAISALVAVVGLVADTRALDLTRLPLAPAVPSDIVQLIDTRVTAFAARDTSFGIGLGISLVVAMWSGSRGMNALIFAISRAHKEETRRGFLASVVMSLAATLGAFVTLTIIVVAVTVIPAIALIWPFPESRETAVLWLRWPILAAVLALAVFILFKQAPDRRSPRARWVVPGAVLATLLWLGGSMALSVFIENFGRYNATFGSIAAAAVFMLWLYFSALVLVSGARLNAELEWRTRRDSTVGPPRPMGEREAYVADTLASDVLRERSR